jgi:hypothetical protein
MKVAAHGPRKLNEVAERLCAAGVDTTYAGEVGEVTADATWIVVHAAERIPPALLSPDYAAKLLLFIDRVTDATESDLLALPTTLPALVVKQGDLGTDEIALAVEKVVGALPRGAALYAPGAAVAALELTGSSDRGQALSTLQRFVRDLSLDARRVAQIVTIADELITNAFYHAPVDGIGGHPYSNISRMDPVEAKPGRAVELHFAKNEHRVVVAVRDRYGSLPERQLRTHLAKAATSPTASFRVSGSSGGARLGLVTALRASSQLIFDLTPGQSAECIGVVETKGTYRDFQEAGRSLHLFTLAPSRA